MASSIAMHSIEQGPDNKLLREFGFIFGLGIAVIFGLLRPWIAAEAFPVWPWIFCGVLGVLALAVPKLLAPLYKGWMKFGTVMGSINSRIILGLMFYGMVLPMGLVMRLAGRDPMQLAFEPDRESYRVPSQKSPIERMEKPY